MRQLQALWLQQLQRTVTEMLAVPSRWVMRSSLAAAVPAQHLKQLLRQKLSLSVQFVPGPMPEALGLLVCLLLNCQGSPQKG